MRVILDTNIFISGIFFGGLPLKILQSWRNQKITIVISPEILAEYIRVGEILNKKYPTIDLTPFISLVAVNTEICNPRPLKVQVCTDPDDDKFLACAIRSNTEIIVSGDKALLAVSGYRGITVTTPRAFYDLYLR